MRKKRQRITLADVAREAGVSAMTVSRVINNTGRISPTTRVRVQAVIDRLGYRPSRAARALVTNRTNMIGVVVPDITNAYFAEIVQGIEDEAWERAYSVLLANTNESTEREQAVLSHVEDSTVDGLIVCSSRLPDDVLVPLLTQWRAVVMVNRQVAPGIASVVRNRYGDSYRAVKAIEHLLAIGRRRIAYLALRHSTTRLSPATFEATLAAGGADWCAEWYQTSAPHWEAGYLIAQHLLTESPELDAIIGGNDLVAVGVLRAAREMGRRVPDDLAIVGGDDTLLASETSPPLTTFRLPKYEIGLTAARLLFTRVGGDTTYREHLYDEELVIRESAPF